MVGYCELLGVLFTSTELLCGKLLYLCDGECCIDTLLEWDWDCLFILDVSGCWVMLKGGVGCADDYTRGSLSIVFVLLTGIDRELFRFFLTLS